MGSIHGGKGNSSKKLSSTLQKPTGRKDSKSGFFDDLNPLAGAAKDFFNTGASAAGQATPAPSVASPVQKAPSMAAMAQQQQQTSSPAPSSDALSSVGSELGTRLRYQTPPSPLVTPQVQQSFPASAPQMFYPPDGFGFSAHLVGGGPPHPHFSHSPSIATSPRPTSESPSTWHCGGPPVVPTTFQVSLPPEAVVVTEASVIPVDVARVGYGSIPHLEASPRRYRVAAPMPLQHHHHHHHQQYLQHQQHVTESPPHSMAVMYTAASNRFQDNAEAVRGLQRSPEEPPRLPEKPSRRAAEASPPPLPPKKPGHQAARGRLPSPQPQSDIYDSPLKSSTTAMEELSKLSVIELNAKMMSGQIPDDLKGMNIVELVEHVASYVRERDEEEGAEVEEKVSEDNHDCAEGAFNMKPSFSDNFEPAPTLPQKSVVAALAQPRQDSTANSLSPGPPTAAAQREFDFAGSGFDDDFSKSPIFPPQINSEPENRLGSATPASSATADSQPPALMTASMEAVEPQTAEDSLKQFVGESSVAPSSKDSAAPEDRYAVFRELQMEDELMRAWKSPSEEEKDVEEEAEENPEDERDSEEEDERGYYEPRICSSEESPHSRSRSRSDEEGEDENRSGRSVSEAEEESKDVSEEASNKRDSQVPLFNDMEVSRNSSFKSSVGGGGGFEDNFESAFGPAKNETVSSTTSGWTTFEAAAGNGSTAQESPRQPQSFEASQQPQWANSPASSRVQQLTARRCSSSASRDSLAEGGENPFGTDAFAPKHHNSNHFPVNQNSHFPGSDSPLARTSVASITSTPIEFPANGVEDAPVDAGALGEFESACFRVHAKVIEESGGGGVPKSDSVNIFAVKQDPFDDDFFT